MAEISAQTEHRNLTNRRVYYRLQMRSVCYVEMGDGNGGVMLNLSEGGFTVQAAEVLAHDRFPSMRFRLPKSERWIEAGGKMVWQGKSGKEAGVEFVDLSDEARQLIRDWMFAQTFAEEQSSQKKGGARPAWESEKALADTASIPRLRTGSQGPAREWASFFPDESDVREKDAPASKIVSLPDNFFPEESTLPLSQPAARLEPASSVESEAPALSPPEQQPQPSARPAESAHGQAQHPAPSGRMLVNAQTSAVEAQPAVPFPVKPPERIQIPNARAADPGIEASISDGARRRNFSTAHSPVSHAPKGTLFNEALSGSLASKSDYLSAYNSEPSRSSRTSWFLTATVAFVAGLGFAWLIAFGPLDFIRAGIHQRLSSANASRPAAAPRDIPGETAPAPPDIFSQSRATPTRDARTSQQTEPQETAAQPQRKAPDQPRESPPSLDEIPQQTESSPVSPSVQQTPGVPTGYVASNSRFLSIRTAPGSREDSATPDGAVRIGQLIYSPQAIYPEEALRLRVEVIVKLRAIIGDDGKIRAVSSLSGPSVLVTAATEAVHDWRYEPTLIGKTPIESEREITFVFRL